MRDIKFRVPHYTFKGDFKGFSYWGRLEEAAFTGPAQWDDGPVKKSDEQYTGLKDKNGKEIYEGDILSCPHYETIEPIRWAGNGFWCVQANGVNHLPTKREVIGNIHENPELLK